MDMCPVRLRDELLYWRIPSSALATCCRYDDVFGRLRLSSVHSLNHVDPEFGGDAEGGKEGSLFGEVWMGDYRRRLWRFFEEPSSSIPAKVWSVCSATFVLLSLAGLIVSSMPEFQLDDEMTPNWHILMLEMW